MIAAWKELFSRKLIEAANACSIDVDEIVQSSHNPQYICRKCFSSYERCQHQQEELLQKVEIAILYFKLRLLMAFCNLIGLHYGLQREQTPCMAMYQAYFPI